MSNISVDNVDEMSGELSKSSTLSLTASGLIGSFASSKFAAAFDYQKLAKVWRQMTPVQEDDRNYYYSRGRYTEVEEN